MTPAPETLYAGLMSGTSIDGIDGVLAGFDGGLRVLAHAHRPFDATLAAELLALNTPGADEVHRVALAGNALARAYAAVIGDLLQAAALPAAAVRAIGAHGQTVRHRPGEFDGTGYTVQINQPALLAELTGIDVVADFRARDVAARGQGAPLVPAFHRELFARLGESVGVLNLGGIGNLTVLAADGPTLGFDTGPGNGLMDHWCRRHTGRAYDDGGAWAAGGRVVAPLLERLRADPYFAKAPPKSTGRDLFNPAWLDAQLAAFGADHPPPAPQDVQATLAELTASTAADALRRHAPEARGLRVCGGGALNGYVMARLAQRLPGVDVRPTDDFGLPAQQVEATAFAWLARALVERRAGNLPSVTGAAGPRLLGALYPA